MDDFAAGLLGSLNAVAVEGATLENKSSVSSRRNREQDGKQSRRNQNTFHWVEPFEGISARSFAPPETPSRPSESTGREKRPFESTPQLRAAMLVET
jgi:hypothetical protein